MTEDRCATWMRPRLRFLLCTGLCLVLLLAAACNRSSPPDQAAPETEQSEEASVDRSRPSESPSLLVWDTIDGGTSNVVGRVLDGRGRPTRRTFTIGERTPGSGEILVVGGIESWLVLWADSADQGFRVLGKTVSEGGRVLGEEPFLIGFTSESEGHVACTYEAPDWIVVWVDADDGLPRLSRVNSRGEVVESPNALQAIESDWFGALSLGSGHKTSLLAWGLGGGGDSDIQGMVIPALQEPRQILVNGSYNDQIAPRVSSNEAGWMVIWLDERDGEREYLYGCRVGFDGTVHDPSGIAIAPAAEYQLVLGDLAPGTDRCMALWFDFAPYESDVQFIVRGAWIDSARGSVDRFTVSESLAEWNSEPVADFNGSSYVLAWQNVDWGRGNSHLLVGSMKPDGASESISLQEVAEEDTNGLGGFLDIASLWHPAYASTEESPVRASSGATAPGDAVRSYWEELAAGNTMEAAQHVVSSPMGQLAVSVDQVLMTSIASQGLSLRHVDVETLEVNSSHATVGVTLYWSDGTSDDRTHTLTNASGSWRISNTE